MIKEYPEIKKAERMGANLYRILVENPPLNLKEAAKDIGEKGYRIKAISSVFAPDFQRVLFTIEREQ